MFEVGLAVGPRGQQHDAWCLATGHLRRALLQRIEQSAVAAADALHVELAKGIGELARNDEPVVQHVTQPRWPLRALRHLPPAAVGPAREVEGDDQQPLPARRPHADHRPQPARVAQQQRRRQQAFVQQALRTVEVIEHAFQQLGTLLHPGFDGGPVCRLDQLRQQLQRPGPRSNAAARHIGEHVVGDAVQPDALRDLVDPAVEFFGHVQAAAGRRQVARKGLPRSTQACPAGTQFIPQPRLGRQRPRRQRVLGCASGLRIGIEGQRTLALRLMEHLSSPLAPRQAATEPDPAATQGSGSAGPSRDGPLGGSRAPASLGAPFTGGGPR